jgi:quinol monooxygenase YgiN
MSLVAVEAAITVVDREHRDALVADEVFAATQKATRDDEPGCLVYCFAADPVQDDLIQVYELWESEEALDVHLQHPNYFKMRDTLGKGGITGAVSRKHRIDASAPVYGNDGNPSGRFE